MIELFKESLHMHFDFLANSVDTKLEERITDIVRALRNGNDEKEIEWCRDLLNFYKTIFDMQEIYKAQIESEYKAISDYYKLSA